MHTLDLAQAQTTTGQLRDWSYNALDVTGTREIHDALMQKLDPQAERIYRFERAVMEPAMAMTKRGVLVDDLARADAVTKLKRELREAETGIGKLPEVVAVWDQLEKVTGKCKKSTRKDGKHTWERGVEDTPERTCVSCGISRYRIAPFNPASPHQVKHLLYDLLNAKPQYGKTGEISTDEDALLRIGKQHEEIKPITDAIIEARGLKKQIGFLTAKLSPSGRFHSSFNVGTAWTGRWSSSKDPYGRGGNLQNIAERHRHVFVADPGMEICYADLKQAESNIVAHLAGDEEYIEAHKSGDVHTYVTRLVWPDLPWTGDLKADKKIAKQNPEWDQAPGHDYRFQAKRIQHGSNYGLSPFGIAMIAKIPLKAAKAAHRAYRTAFPHIFAWQREVRKLVENQEPLTNPLGRRVELFGRPWDDHTYKQGLAFLPQSAVADIINIAIWRVWKELELSEQLQLLAQVHDAIMFQYPKGNLAVVHKVMGLMTIPVPVTDIYGTTRIAKIETEAAVGANWGHKSRDNPYGLVEI